MRTPATTSSSPAPGSAWRAPTRTTTASPRAR
jgi:hypothetical protein